MFSPDDFADTETSKMLNVVVMMKIGKPPLTNFHKMIIKDKKIFNTTLNEYIKTFLDETWKETLIQEFNRILTDEIFNEEFKASNYEPIQINPEPVLLE
tara:strand:- start:38 stop:334 length:297 start_codon:yes stop_codon:yes gene_type:complete